MGFRAKVLLVPQPRKMKIKVGPKWWDRNDHVSFKGPASGYQWQTTGFDEHEIPFEWPRPCVICVSEGDKV